MSAIAKRKGNLPHLASELDFDRGRHVIKHLVIHDDDFQCIPMAKLDREVIPVLLAQNFGHRGIDGSGRHFRGMVCNTDRRDGKSPMSSKVGKVLTMWKSRSAQGTRVEKKKENEKGRGCTHHLQTTSRGPRMQ